MNEISKTNGSTIEPAERSINITGNRLTPYSFEEDRHNPLPYPLSLEAVPAKRTKEFAGLRRNIMIGVATLAIFASGVSTIVAQTIIAGAVIAHGNLVVASGPKQVQHLSGGIVKEILVKENQSVKAGEPLVRLDMTIADAQLKAASIGLAQSQARLDRLISERDGLEEVRFSETSDALRADPDFAAIFASEAHQYRLRREERDGERAQLRERISQARQEERGNVSQLESRKREIVSLDKELVGLRSLFSRGLVSQQRFNELERELSQLQGTVGALESSVAAGQGKVSELELMILQVDQNLRSQLTDQIAEAQQSITTLTEKKVAANEQLMQSVITAPQSGTVYQLAVHTTGGVVRPAETLMTIVPEQDQLIGVVKINPVDIEQLYAGQAVRINFSALDRGTTPTINATLQSISPDLEQDQKTGVLFYQARIAVPATELARLGDITVVPGMPIEAFVQTGDRTLVSYFIKPITDQMNRAFR